MKAFTMNYTEVNVGRYIFEAKSLEQAQELRRQVIEGEIDLDDLPNLFIKSLNIDETIEQVSEVA